MAIDYASACDAIMAVVRTQTWIRQAPNDAPAVAAAFPFAAIFPGTGETVSDMAGWLRCLYTVHLEVHWAFKDLPRATDDAKYRIQVLEKALWTDPTVSATMDTLTAIRHEFGPMTWGSIETLGFILRISFKQRVAL